MCPDAIKDCDMGTRHSETKMWSILEMLGGRDVTQIFLHDVVSFRPEFRQTATVPGRDKDIEKALAIARRHDLVCVYPGIHQAQLEMLSGLGIGPDRKNLIRLKEDVPSRRGVSHAIALIEDGKQIDEICQKIPRTGSIVLNPYISTPDCLLLAREIKGRLGREVSITGGETDIVNLCIQKHWISERARERGIPVAEGETVEIEMTDEGIPSDLRPMKEAIVRQFKAGGAVLIKNAVAVLPSKIIRISQGPESIEAALCQIQQNHQTSMYMVEVLYDVTVSPNILFHIAAGTGPVRCVGITDQRLSANLAHCGNMFPSRATTLRTMVEAAQHFSEWLQSKGYCGIVGYDFCEYIDRITGKPACFLAEVNPRINGSVYPLSIMAHLTQTLGVDSESSIKAFLSAKWFKIRAHSFEELRDKFGSFFYAPGKSAGIVPYNTGSLDQGIIDFVVVGQSRKATQGLFRQIQRAFVSR